jgi:hypothetical protein
MDVAAHVGGCPFRPGLQVDIVGEMTTGLTCGGGCVAGTICAVAGGIAAIVMAAAIVARSLCMAGPHALPRGRITCKDGRGARPPQPPPG